jgi:hypothetical protein
MAPSTASSCAVSREELFLLVGPKVQFGRHDNAIDKGIVEEFTRYVPLIR